MLQKLAEENVGPELLGEVVWNKIGDEGDGEKNKKRKENHSQFNGN